MSHTRNFGGVPEHIEGLHVRAKGRESFLCLSVDRLGNLDRLYVEKGPKRGENPVCQGVEVHGGDMTAACRALQRMWP